MVSCAGGSAGHNGSRNDGQQLGRPPDTGLYIVLGSSGGGRSSTCSESPHSHSLSPILHWNGKCAFCEAAAAAASSQKGILQISGVILLSAHCRRLRPSARALGTPFTKSRGKNRRCRCRRRHRRRCNRRQQRVKLL